MTYLSRSYALEVQETGTGARTVQLTRRGEGATVFASSFAYAGLGARLDIQESFEGLDAEARRLLQQWAFDDLGAPTLSLPIPTQSEALQAWAALGARVQGEGRLSLSAADFAATNRAAGCKGAAWLERALPVVPVACVALVNEQDQVLLAQRPTGKPQAGLWELPGGKLEPGESPELALCREMQEELGIHIWNSCLAPLTFVSHAYETFHLTMFAYVCYRWEGAVQGREGQAFNWAEVKDIDPKIMPAANAPLVHALQDLLA